MRARVLISGGLLAASISAAAAEAQTATLDLQGVVANKTVVLHTPAGGLPISYSDNGTMIGRAKDMEFSTGSAFDRGTWWVVANKICHRWRSWLGGKDHCVTVKMDGDTVLWKSSDGYSGTATIGAKK
jgi:hypothetical protein